MTIADLVVSSTVIEEAAVERAVKTFFRYTEKGEIIIHNKEFWKLSGEEKLLRFLAAITGKRFLDLEGPQLNATNRELSKCLNMNESSVRVYVSSLRSRGLVETTKDGHGITTQGLHDLSEEGDGR